VGESRRQPEPRLSGRTGRAEGRRSFNALKYLLDGVQDDGYFQILKNCDHGGWALEQSRKVAPDWTHWTRSYALLESVRVKVGNQIEALGCSR
jgi:hypothetical protein